MKNNFPPKTMALLPNSAILTKKVIILPRSGKLKTTNPIEKEDVTARKKNIKELDELQVSLSDAKEDKNRRIGK